MTKKILVFIFISIIIEMIFAGCKAGGINEYSFLKDSDTLLIQNCNSKVIDISENQFRISNNKLEIEKIVDLIINSKIIGNGTYSTDINKNSCYALIFIVYNGQTTNGYPIFYSPNDNMLLLPPKPGSSHERKLIKISVSGDLKTILDDAVVKYSDFLGNTNQKEIIKDTLFIIWMGAEKWAMADGKIKGVYEMKLENKNYHLYLISLGEQQYGSMLRGNLPSNLNEPDLKVNVLLAPPSSTVPELKSHPFLVLRTLSNQSPEVRWVSADGKILEVLKNQDTNYYDPLAEAIVIK